MTDMTLETQLIENTFYEGERPLFACENMTLEKVRFYPGESALKHSKHVVARACEFLCKYPFWHSDNVLLEDNVFTVYGRAAIWYTQNVVMRHCKVDAPKMFRKVSHVSVENTVFSSAGETFWWCDNITLDTVQLRGADYVFMHGEHIEINDMHMQGNYSFQEAKNVVIRNSHLESKDAFWESENVTVYDSVLDGEYLGWHSKNLRLVNCTIRGEQPFCYCENLVLENCVMSDDAELGFEYSSVEADIKSHVVSIKNPKSGYIRAKSVGEIILDEHRITPSECTIETEE